MSWAWRRVFRSDPPWNDDCVTHDYAYWQGGTAQQRQLADRNLLINVATRGYCLIAVLMWLAVRAGGHPLLPLSWRWGYGFKYPRRYTR